MRILVLLTSFLITHSLFSQSLIEYGKLFNSNQPVKITCVSTNDYGETAVAGTFYDSLEIGINGSSTELFGGSSANGVHNAFVVTYDQYGYIMGAIRLGSATDSITVTGIDFSTGDVAITGTFSSSIDFSGGITSPQVLTATGGNDAFVARYGYDLYLNWAAIIETTGSYASGTAISSGDFGNVYVTGFFNGTIDLDPTGNNIDFVSVGTYNGFIVDIANGGSYNSGGIFEGNGIIKPMAIDFDYNSYNVSVTGKFNTDADFDLVGNSVTMNTTGGYDAFLVTYDYTLAYLWNVHLGGSGNQIGKYIATTYYGNPVLLLDFENTVEMNPNGTSFQLNSNGMTDVAIAEYDQTGMLVFAKGFGNGTVNEGHYIAKAAYSGGRGGPPPVINSDLTFSMNFSGTMDFDPDVTNIAMSTATNSVINAAIIDIDSLGNYITHGTNEASSILGIAINGYNEVTIAGNFQGTNMDVLPYDSVATLSNSVSAGYVTIYNRCRISGTTPELAGPYTCGECDAVLHFPNLANYRSPLNIDWYHNTISYYTNGMEATGVCPTDSGYYEVYINDKWGCSAYDTLVFSEATMTFDVLLNVVSTSCGNNFGSADITPVNPVGNISYQWSNGSTTNMVDSLIAGSYTVEVLDDVLNCYYNTPFVIDNSDGPTISLVSVTNADCNNVDNGMIDISVSGGSSPYTFEWSNGATTEDISNLSGGNYSVTVTDATGCENYYCADIYQGEDIYAYMDNYWASSCLNNDGTIMIASGGGSGPHSYLWDANAGSSTNDTVYNLFAGQYILTVTDSLGCTEDFLFGISDWNGPYIWLDYTVQPTCTGTPGMIDIYSWDAISTYSWSNGGTTEDLNNIQGGEYLLTATDFSGCISTIYVNLEDELPVSPTICMVTTDSTATQNVVVFDKSNSPEADYYKIYREGYCNVNDFGVVGYVDEDSLSVFYDTVVNSDTRSWRYYVTAVDTCGNESDPSIVHKTIHLTADWDNDTNIVLDWSDYVGMDILRYKIYRRQAVGTLFDLVDSVDVTQTNYLDTINFFGYSELEYFIDAVPVGSCNATRAYNQNEARSNHAKRNVPEAITLTVQAFENTNINLYPNPTSDLVHLVVDDKENWNVQIVNHVGQVVINGTVNGRVAFSTNELSQGIYFVKLKNPITKESKVMKLVIAR